LKPGTDSIYKSLEPKLTKLSDQLSEVKSGHGKRIDDLYKIIFGFKTTNTKLIDEVESLRTTLEGYEIPEELNYKETPESLSARNKVLEQLWHDNPELMLAPNEEIITAELVKDSDEILAELTPIRVMIPAPTKTDIHRAKISCLRNLANIRGINTKGKTKKEIQAALFVAYKNTE